VARGVGKHEYDVAKQMMQQLKKRGHPESPPAIATDGEGAYREWMVQTWGKVPTYNGFGRPPTWKQPQKDFKLLQLIKKRSGMRILSATPYVVYGEQEEVEKVLQPHTAYIERTHLTSRHINGKLVRRSLSFSKCLDQLKASLAWTDAIYNFTRPVRTLRLEVKHKNKRWVQRSPAMVAGLTDHIWTIKELVTAIVPPNIINSK